MPLLPPHLLRLWGGQNTTMSSKMAEKWHHSGVFEIWNGASRGVHFRCLKFGIFFTVQKSVHLHRVPMRKPPPHTPLDTNKMIMMLCRVDWMGEWVVYLWRVLSGLYNCISVCVYMCFYAILLLTMQRMLIGCAWLHDTRDWLALDTVLCYDADNADDDDDEDCLLVSAESRIHICPANFQLIMITSIHDLKLKG